MSTLSLSMSLRPPNLSPAEDGLLMFLYGFGVMVLIIASHGFLLISMVLPLARSKKYLNVQHPFRLKLLFMVMIILILALHTIEIQCWALFVWTSDYYRGFVSSLSFAGLAYSTLGLYGQSRYEQWQQALPLMIAFSGMFCTGLSGSMLFTLLMSAVQFAAVSPADAPAAAPAPTPIPLPAPHQDAA